MSAPVESELKQLLEKATHFQSADSLHKLVRSLEAVLNIQDDPKTRRWIAKEILPIAVWGKQQRGIQLRWCSENNSAYDAEYKTLSDNVSHAIEVTLAHSDESGQQHEFMMRHLREHGHAAFNADNKFDRRTKTTQMDCSTLNFESLPDYCQRLFRLIRDAINRKCSKTYPNDTMLLVVANQNAKIANFQTSDLEALLRECLESTRGRFSRIDILLPGKTNLITHIN